jgi:hypothetical protein
MASDNANAGAGDSGARQKFRSSTKKNVAVNSQVPLPSQVPGQVDHFGTAHLANGFRTKKELAAHLLKQGVTAAELLSAAGFAPKTQISIPALAKKLNLTLEKFKEGGVTKYKGIPLSSECEPERP